MLSMACAQFIPHVVAIPLFCSSFPATLLLCICIRYFFTSCLSIDLTYFPTAKYGKGMGGANLGRWGTDKEEGRGNQLAPISHPPTVVFQSMDY